MKYYFLFIAIFWLEDRLVRFARPILCPACKSPDTWFSSGDKFFHCHCCGYDFKRPMNWFRNFKWKRWNRAVRNLPGCWRCETLFDLKCQRCGTSMCSKCDRGYQGNCTKQRTCP